MRKVGSAPSLISSGGGQSQERQEPAPHLQRIPKSVSTSSLSKLGSNAQKDGLQRRGSLPGRLRETRTRAFPLATVAPSTFPPPEPVMTEEFAESARGLAGLECFELYGPQADGPALRTDEYTKADQKGPTDSNQQQSDQDAAFAACLATPLTGQDKNLGELVDAEARAMLQASQEGISARYEQELSSQETALLELASPERDFAARRKRRLSEWYGLGRREKRASTIFEDCPEAQQLLSNLASLDDENNTAPLQENSGDSRDTLFPTKEVDEGIFHWQPPPRNYSDESLTTPLSRSI